MGLDQATRLLLVRHGETDWNVQNRIQGHQDTGLNRTGRLQARALHEALAAEAIDAVYASDLGRALETARIAMPGHAVRREPGLRERAFGCFEGSSWGEIAANWPVESERWRRRDPEFAAPGGERLADFYTRSVATLERLARAHAGQTLLVVSHGGVLDCCYRAASGQSLQAARSWVLGNAAINRLLFTGEGFSLIGWNDDHHLATLSLDETGA